MEYILEVPALLGDIASLDAVACAMAKRAANASSRGFHRPTYEGKLSAYRSAIVDAAQVGQLKVCDQQGSVGTSEVILDASKRNHSFIEVPNNEIFTLALNVYVSLYQLNIWAKERGDVFHITNHGVAWIDESGWQNANGSPPPLEIEATPAAPVHVESIEALWPPISDAATSTSTAHSQTQKHRVCTRKKAALIAELEHEWPAIKADISDATRNGLKAAAHTAKHGEWDRDKARAWAMTKGKINQAAPLHHLDGAWAGATTRHIIDR